MINLEFPVIENVNLTKKILSMDEYLKFVQFNLTYTLDKEAYAKWKKRRTVNTRFLLLPMSNVRSGSAPANQCQAIEK